MNELQNGVNYNYFSVILGNCGNYMRWYLWLCFVSYKIVEHCTTIKNYAWLISLTFPDSLSSFWTHQSRDHDAPKLHEKLHLPSWDLSHLSHWEAPFCSRSCSGCHPYHLSVPPQLGLISSCSQSLILTPPYLQLDSGPIQFSCLGWSPPH